MERRCKGWAQEGALRCLLNNLDPAVAERPEDLVVTTLAGDERPAPDVEAEWFRPDRLNARLAVLRRFT